METGSLKPKENEVVRARVATSFIFLVSGLGYSSWAPMVPYAKANLELSEASLGLILLIFGIGGLVAMPMTGWAVHRFGSALITTLASLSMIVFIPLLAIAPTWEVLALLLFAFGVADGALNVSMNAQSVAVESHAGKPILSSFHCLFSLGGLLGAGIMSLLLKQEMTLFASALCLFLTMAAIVLCNCRNLLPARADIQTKESHTFSLPSGRVLFYGTVCFILFLAEGSMLDWGAVFLCSAHQYDPSIAGIGYATFSVAMAIGRLTGDRLISKFGRVMIVQSGGLFAASGLFLLVTCPTGYLELVGFFLIGLGASNIVPIIFGATGKLPNISPSVALTCVITMGYTGMLLGPAFIGWIAEVTTLSFALGCVATLLFAVGLTASKIRVQTQ
ncbi:MAG: MFS transporter [Verrucomicrobia bacterium]|nr:MFS transporter [Verrucomicrobiota bacterium]